MFNPHCFGMKLWSNIASITILRLDTYLWVLTFYTKSESVCLDVWNKSQNNLGFTVVKQEVHCHEEFLM